MVLKGFFANINIKLENFLEVMDIRTELSIKSNPLITTLTIFVLIALLTLCTDAYPSGMGHPVAF